MKEKFTWPTRVIALGFIGLILVTNVWLHYYLFGGEMPSWAYLMIDVSTILIVLGALAHAFLWIKKRLSSENE